MKNRIGGKEALGVIIREEGAIVEAQESHKRSSRYLEQQLENLRQTGMAAGVLSADFQESVNLKYADLFNSDGNKLVAVAIGGAAVDTPEDELSRLALRAATGMGISENKKVAVFSPLEPDLKAAASLGMIRVRTGQKSNKPIGFD
ncbi:hypothetical protein HZB78_01910 [Candidatus Collierbacteria bacterium]|nr:hypothetical protein [Candidatus Collierbacteria bacterium]